MKQRSVNTFFYGFVLLFLLAIHVFHVHLLSTTSTLASVFFYVHALVQVAIEFLLIFGTAQLIHRYCHRGVYYFYVSMVFVLLNIHVADFVLVRIMSLPFLAALDLILDETFENFIEMLLLTGIPLHYWILMGISGLVVMPSIAIATYLFTKRWGRDVSVRKRDVFGWAAVLPLLLVALDIAFLPYVSKKEHEAFASALPYKGTVVPFYTPTIKTSNVLSKPMYPTIDAQNVDEKYLPNIYLFVVESLREDYITEETSPNIVRFREEHIALPLTLSNGNGTQVSWYSIFHSKLPLHWSESRERTSDGALPLCYLKSMGYEINLYSSAQLSYYNMDTLIFGKDSKLLTSSHVYPHYSPTPACKSDLAACDQLFSDIQRRDKQHGNIFVIFLDSTHFEYSWPQDYPAPFVDPTEDASFISLSGGETSVASLTSRYKNSIHFVDDLFGQFVSLLKKQDLYDEACIVYTGDHGEEFYEEGKLYHASHLSTMQTRAPIYYKLGTNSDIDADSISVSSHVDIFPTIIDHVTEQGGDLSLYDGKSLLRDEPNRYAVVARYNGSRTPYEFYLHNGSSKCLMQFGIKKNVYSSDTLRVLRSFVGEDEVTNKGEAWVKKEFAQFFSDHFRAKKSL